MMAIRSSKYFIKMLCLFLMFIGSLNAVPLPAEESSHNVYPRQTEQLCYNQDIALVPQAAVHSHAALEKANGIYEVMKSFFTESLSSCQSTFSMKLPHNLVIFNYYITHFDVNHIIPAMESNHNCSHMQEEMNSTLSFLECATDFMGSILKTLTSDAIQYTPSNTTITTRQAVYQAYKNVTWISDLKKLTKVFPCAKPNSPQSVATCTATYDSIEISQYDYPYNACIDNVLSSESAEHQKQIVVLAHVTELVERVKYRLYRYTGNCL